MVSEKRLLWLRWGESDELDGIRLQALVFVWSRFRVEEERRASSHLRRCHLSTLTFERLQRRRLQVVYIIFNHDGTEKYAFRVIVIVLLDISANW